MNSSPKTNWECSQFPRAGTRNGGTMDQQLESATSTRDLGRDCAVLVFPQLKLSLALAKVGYGSPLGVTVKIGWFLLSMGCEELQLWPIPTDLQRTIKNTDIEIQALFFQIVFFQPSAGYSNWYFPFCSFVRASCTWLREIQNGISRRVLDRTVSVCSRMYRPLDFVRAFSRGDKPCFTFNSGGGQRSNKGFDHGSWVSLQTFECLSSGVSLLRARTATFE